MKDSYIHVRQDEELREMAEELAKDYEGNVSLMVRSLIRKAFKERKPSEESQKTETEAIHA